MILPNRLHVVITETQHAVDVAVDMIDPLRGLDVLWDVRESIRAQLDFEPRGPVED